MPQVRYAPSALRDLQRLREFLRTKNPRAAKRAALAITNAIKLLEQYPQIGRPAFDMGEHVHELPIAFGDDGYIALYRYDADLVLVLAIRHQSEAGY